MNAPEVDASGLTVLSAQECLRLLGEGGVGRVAVIRDDVPAVRPVNFALAPGGGHILIRTGEGGPVWTAADRHAPASFEIDEISAEDHSAWSVLVTGTLDHLDEEPDVPLQVWTANPKERTVALSVDSLSGRRIADHHRAPPAPDPKASSSLPDVVVPDVSVDEDGIDHWGRSEDARRRTRRLLDPAYRRWFRVRWEGLEHVPAEGGALLVANHAGALPIDATLLIHGIEQERGRAVYGLHHHGLRATPMVGRLLARNGGVVATPANALRLLRERQLVLVFPEGTKGTTKPYHQRYRLARFGRGGFVETALRAGVPIVPIAVVGSEETMPTLFRLPVGPPPGWPVTLNALLFGPLGAVLHFPAAITARVLAPIVPDDPGGLDSYPAYRVADVADTVRARIQDALDDMVRERPSAWRR